MAPPADPRARSARTPHAWRALAAVAFSLTASAARAAVITVDSTADDYAQGPNGNCTLREAVIASNTDAWVDRCSRGLGSDTIQLPPGTYVLSIPGRGENAAHAGDLDITDAVTILAVSPQSTVIDAGQVDGGFDVRAQNATTSMSDLTVRNAAGANVAVHGGQLSLDAVDLRDAHPASPTAGGLGLEVASGSATISDVRILGNQGAGIQVSGGTATIRATTIGDATATPGECTTGNASATAGGGVLVKGGTVEIQGSTIAGNCSGPSGGRGGGVAVLGGVVTLSRSVVARNAALDDAGGGGGVGGGIAVAGGSLSMTQVEVAANYANTTTGAQQPSGLGVVGPAHVEVDRSTFLGNHRVAIAVSDPAATLVIRDSTVAAQPLEAVTAPPGAPLTSSLAISAAGAVSVIGSTLDVADVPGAPLGVLAGPGTFTVVSSVLDGPCSTDVLGAPAVQSQGFNLTSADVCAALAQPSDLVGANPLLAPIGNYGGPTPTRPPLPWSPAIDSGNPEGCSASDQRGFSRPQDGDVDGTPVCDRGAVEVMCAGTIGPDGSCIPVVGCGSIPGVLGTGADAALAPMAGGLVLLLGWRRRRLTRRLRSG